METETKTAVQEREPVQPRRTAVIVGASSGIGRETALKLSARGFRVFNVSRTQFKGERVRSITADAAQEGELSKAIHGIGEECDGIDLLVYSAGFSMAAPLEYAKSGDYRYLFEVNYFGAIEALRAATPYLKKRNGRAVLVGSIGGDMPIPYDSFYSSSKAALTMLAREADVELRARACACARCSPAVRLPTSLTAAEFTARRRASTMRRR